MGESKTENVEGAIGKICCPTKGHIRIQKLGDNREPQALCAGTEKLEPVTEHMIIN